jgi:hypothetical protein
MVSASCRDIETQRVDHGGGLLGRGEQRCVGGLALVLDDFGNVEPSAMTSAGGCAAMISRKWRLTRSTGS